MTSARPFLYDDVGATAVEYALLVGLIAILVIKGVLGAGLKGSVVFG